jgi:hypothetical protein
MAACSSRSNCRCRAASRRSARPGDQVVAPPGQAAEQRGRAQREDVAAAQPAPDRGQFLRGGCGGGPGGEERGVQGVGRGADEQVRRDAALVQGMDHPGLHGAQGGAAGQHERVRGAHAARPAAGPAMLVLVLISGQL